MYLVYGGFCLLGFVSWWRLQRNAAPAIGEPETAEAAT